MKHPIIPPKVGLVVRGRSFGRRTTSTYKLQLLQTHDYVDQGKVVVVVAKDIRVFMGDFTELTGTHVFAVPINLQNGYYVVKWNIAIQISNVTREQKRLKL